MMFPSHFDYLKNQNIIWFNPCWGYHGFWKRLNEFRQKQGIDFLSSWSHRDMKRNKEIYVTAMVALAMQQDVPNGWWFTKPLHDPPDGVIGTIISDGERGNIMNVREVEIVEHLKGSIVNTLKEKLKNKAYEPNTILVCLLSPSEPEVFDLLALSQQLQDIQFSLAHIFVAFHGFKEVNLPGNPTSDEIIKEALKVAIVQLFPKYAVVNFDPYNCCKAWQSGKEQSWLKFVGRGRGIGLEKVTVDAAPKLFD